MAIECPDPLCGVVVNPPSNPIGSLKRLRYITAITNQVNESRVGIHPSELGQDLDIGRRLIPPTNLAFGLQVPSINDLNHITQLRPRELTHRAAELLRAELHLGPAVVAGND